MSVQTPTTRRQHRTSRSTEPAAERRRRAGRTVIASLVVGAVATLLPIRAAFAGGTEATITGAVLLGFGLGWALMAVLTVRRTEQPQRWAYVPAVAMSATGVALVTFTPGNETMAALNW